MGRSAACAAIAAGTITAGGRARAPGGLPRAFAAVHALAGAVIFPAEHAVALVFRAGYGNGRAHGTGRASGAGNPGSPLCVVSRKPFAHLFPPPCVPRSRVPTGHRNLFYYTQFFAGFQQASCAFCANTCADFGMWGRLSASGKPGMGRAVQNFSKMPDGWARAPWICLL